MAAYFDLNPCMSMQLRDVDITAYLDMLTQYALSDKRPSPLQNSVPAPMTRSWPIFPVRESPLRRHESPHALMLSISTLPLPRFDDSEQRLEDINPLDRLRRNDREPMPCSV